MEMCPYCGEEVPDETAKCWKCGAILQDVDDESAEAMAPEAGPSLAPCPYCNAPQPPKAHRCKECGRVMNAFEEGESQDKWKYGTWIAFGGVALMVVLVLAIAVLTTEPIENRQYASTSYRALSGKYSSISLRNREVQMANEWKEKYFEKYVKWTGIVVSIDGNTVEIAMSAEARKQKKAEVRVEFLSSARQYVDSLAADKEVSYDARLVSYKEEGVRFRLDRGREKNPE